MAKKTRPINLDATLHDATEFFHFSQTPQAEVATTPQVEYWQIVVAGQLDPRYHHPYWYHQIEAITEEEKNKALQGNCIFAQGIAIFSIPAFHITVQPDSWQIQASSKESCERILKVASVVFARLWEVPVIAYGINCQLHVETKADKVGQIFANKLSQMDLGFPEAENPIAKFIWASESKDFVPNITLSPSPFLPNRLILTFNGHHPIHEQKHFDLAEKMGKVAMPDWDYAQGVALRIAEKINKESVETDGAPKR